MLNHFSPKADRPFTGTGDAIVLSLRYFRLDLNTFRREDALPRFRLALIALALFLGLSGSTGQASSPGHFRDFGDAGGFLNILPPGQDGVLNGPEAIFAQAGQYPPFFARGYTGAEDRLFLMDVLRHVGRARVSGSTCQISTAPRTLSRSALNSIGPALPS